MLEDLGFKCKVVPRIEAIGEGIDMVRQMLPMCRFDAARCGEQVEGTGFGLIPALKAYRKEWSQELQVFRDHPLHDWSSNWVDAFRQAAQGFEPEKQRQEAKRKKRSGNWKTA